MIQACLRAARAALQHAFRPCADPSWEAGGRQAFEPHGRLMELGPRHWLAAAFTASPPKWRRDFDAGVLNVQGKPQIKLGWKHPPAGIGKADDPTVGDDQAPHVMRICSCPVQAALLQPSSLEDRSGFLHGNSLRLRAWPVPSAGACA